MDLRGTLPINTYQFLLNTDGSNVFDGQGNRIQSLNLTSSYAITQVSYEVSSSFASSSLTSSHVQGDYISSSVITASSLQAVTLFQLPVSSSSSVFTLTNVTGSSYVDAERLFLFVYTRRGWTSASLA